MKAAILTGGKGTRMRHITQGIPKTLLLIGGIPILMHHINLLKQEGIKEVYLLTGYMAKKIEDYFKSATISGITIHFLKEDHPLGTSGGLKCLETIIQEDFLLFYGDVMINMDLRSLIRFHERKSPLATLVVHPNDHHNDSDVVQIDRKMKINGFFAKDRDPTLYYDNIVSAGLYVLSPNIFHYIPERKGDFVKNVFSSALLKGEDLYAYKTAEYLKDAGTPCRLEQVREDYERGVVAQKNRKKKQKAIFMDRDGVLNVSRGFITLSEQLILLPYAGETVKKINNSHYLSIVVTNQSVIARNLCNLKGLHFIHQKLEFLLSQKKAYLDAIYFCPHHPDKGYPEERKKYKIQCDCRKPAAGMILKAQKEFNIDLSQSFMIGDQISDIQLGKNCGMTSILIKTEDKYKTNELDVKPDYCFNSLIEAVNFIID